MQYVCDAHVTTALADTLKARVRAHAIFEAIRLWLTHCYKDHEYKDLLQVAGYDSYSTKKL